jgi:NAD(P)H-hydrate epimerase
VVDIGLAAAALAAIPERAALLEASDAARLVPRRAPDAHKGDAGHVLIIAGSFGHTGAAQLAARGAGRAGAGLVTLVGPESLYPAYAAGVLEAMTATLPDDAGRIRFDAARLAALAAGKQAVVIGPGVGTHDGAAATVRWLLDETVLPIVLDADALTIVARDPSALRRAAGRAVLTPHPGEMSRLSGAATAAIQADRVGSARRFASEHGCTLVLKGARTVVAEPGGLVWINATGNPGMASGGMGDVLAGVIGGLLAQRLAPAEAACLGVYVHGLAGDRAAADGAIGLLAGDVAEALRPALASLVTT